MTSATKHIQPKTFFAYLVFGGLTSAFCVTVGAVIFQFAPQLGFATINVVAGILGIFVNFSLNLIFNFGGLSSRHGSVVGSFVRFFAVALTGIAIVYLLSAGLSMAWSRIFPGTSLLNSSTLIRSSAQSVILIAVAVLSYLGHALFSFRRRPDAGA